MDFFQYFFRYYWQLVYMICLMLYITMYILIYNFTGKTLQTVKYFLYPSCTAMLIAMTMAFATQTRNIDNTHSMALLCDGFCKYIGPTFCFYCYNLYTAFGIVVNLINLHTMYYRTLCLKYLDAKKVRLWTLVFMWHYLCPLIYLIVIITSPQRHLEVSMETLSLHPNFDYTPYLTFGGFSQAQKELLDKAAMSLSLISMYYPLIGTYWKHKAMKMLKSHMSPNTSDATRAMLQTLIKGLNFQILLPMLRYIPLTAIYFMIKYTGEQFLISQYTITVLGTIPCILDPLVQIYFIRDAIRKFLACNSSPVRRIYDSWASRMII
ncbi:Serpentine receptor class delta-63 [Caenorhabditis elegans]|uniref:Serpentine receptor class delta-63 n=1 Tax=Caenorhabditis elegans TaxID=6239 RepID=SRD63_CAEEL|nr:Serpentine receptor class delta-63 [Caenorhabditis elegans]O17800.2 RecName: Full=Serpentine receptor class delta-63; Short=Protein srd-63 [Caenorhabditis elegans]CAB07574.2 Serpentine receptor class delta-63 [Caenorhabditis elegans]|eukprot:NP_507143.2 Serpentine receptor class delta-63 [Caenorhabditis elegans]